MKGRVEAMKRGTTKVQMTEKERGETRKVSGWRGKGSREIM